MKRFFFLFLLPFLFTPLFFAQAIDYTGNLGSAGDAAGLSVSGQPNQPLFTVLGGIAQAAMGLLGVLLLLLTIYAGFLWMTAQGNEEQVTKAKGMIQHAVIGLIIVISAYSIASFVVDRIQPSPVTTTG